MNIMNLFETYFFIWKRKSNFQNVGIAPRQNVELVLWRHLCPKLRHALTNRCSRLVENCLMKSVESSKIIELIKSNFPVHHFFQLTSTFRLWLFGWVSINFDVAPCRPSFESSLRISPSLWSCKCFRSASKFTDTKLHWSHSSFW